MVLTVKQMAEIYIKIKAQQFHLIIIICLKFGHFTSGINLLGLEIFPCIPLDFSDVII